ncbi:MAG: SLBB domain-containing protein [Proteobacteria bacterium]|nr:SLBB domain-containing protein [Pseudomonadota bacterium]
MMEEKTLSTWVIRFMALVLILFPADFLFALESPEQSKIEFAPDTQRQSKIELFYETYEEASYNQYGYDVLMGGTIVSPIFVGPDYRVGPKDVVHISIWGGSLKELGSYSKKETSTNFVEYNLKVNDSGSMIVPEIGMISVNGITLDELKKVVSQKFKNYCRDCSVALTIDEPRVIEILVTGNVAHPGYVQVLAGSSLYDVLLAAGGVTKQGSLRRIMLSRADKKEEFVDMYQFINTGELGSLPTVQLKDSVHVNAIGRVVLMKGQVNLTGIFEMKDGETLNDVMNYAGGVLPDCEKNHIEITRFGKDGRTLINHEGPPETCQVENGDSIHFLKQYNVIKDSVRLMGYVPVVKAYTWHENYYLKEIIGAINTFKPETSLEYAEIRRYDKLAMEPSIISFCPQDVLNNQTKESKDAQILLQPLDEIVLFSKDELKETPMVSISGGIQKPGKYRFLENMTILNLIRSAGGIKWMGCDQGKIVRYDYNDQKKWTTSDIDFNFQDINHRTSPDISLKPLDRVIVNSRSDFMQTEWQVAIEGQVNYPGSYPIGSQTKLSDVITYSGMLTDNADLGGLTLIREDAKAIQSKHQKTAENILRKGLLDVAAHLKNTYLTEEERNENKQSMAIVQNYLDHIENTDIQGRVLLNEKDLSSLEVLKQSPSDVLLQNGDRIVIPEKKNMITIVGEVYNPASYLFRDKSRVSDYLAQAGGIAPYADFKSSFIVRNNGTVVSYAQKEGGFDDVIMKPGDVLIIPSKTFGLSK